MASHGGDDNDASWWLNPANFQSAGTILFTTTVVTVVVVSGMVWRVLGKGRPNNYRDMTEQYNREFKGKTIIVTGANSGVGFTAAKQIAEHGANVILACRDESRAKKAMEDIKSMTGNQQISYQLLDISDLNSIRQFARRIKSCHILLNNAGAVMGHANQINGMESTMMTNYVGPWYLTRLLLPVLAKTSIEENCETRVINVGSRSENSCPLGKEYETDGQKAIDRLFDYAHYDPNKHKPMKQYAYSKLGNMLFSYELARQLDQYVNKSKDVNPVASSFMLFDKEVVSDQGIIDCLSKFEGRKPRIICNVVTPGFTNTDIFRFSPAIYRILSAPLRPLLLKSAEVGGSELVYACSQSGVNGVYFGEHMEVPSSDTAKSPQVGGALWKTTEMLVGNLTSKRG